jgi:exosortase
MVNVVEQSAQNTQRPWRSRMRQTVRNVVPCGLLVVAFLSLYASVLPPLVTDWFTDPDYSHGFLVPVLSGYFVWQRRQILAALAVQPCWWGLAVLLLGVCSLLLGNIAAEFFLMRSSMLVVLTGLVLSLLGWHHLRVLCFPIAFLLFMIPLPAILLNTITLPLQMRAAEAATSALHLVQMPVYREGNIIFLPHTTLEVVEACSGIRSLVSLLALAVVFATITQRQVWKQWVLVLSAIPIALTANALRIWGTGVMAHVYGTQLAEGFYHTFAGWLIFVVAFGLLLAESFFLSMLHRTSVHRKETRS